MSTEREEKTIDTLFTMSETDRRTVVHAMFTTKNPEMQTEFDSIATLLKKKRLAEKSVDRDVAPDLI